MEDVVDVTDPDDVDPEGDTATYDARALQEELERRLQGFITADLSVDDRAVLKREHPSELAPTRMVEVVQPPRLWMPPLDVYLDRNMPRTLHRMPAVVAPPRPPSDAGRYAIPGNPGALQLRALPKRRF